MPQPYFKKYSDKVIILLLRFCKEEVLVIDDTTLLTYKRLLGRTYITGRKIFDNHYYN